MYMCNAFLHTLYILKLDLGLYSIPYWFAYVYCKFSLSHMAGLTITAGQRTNSDQLRPKITGQF